MDNVYEVTIVASAAGGSDELPVTVKVINSTDDNAPGEVTFSIRQPEVAIRFEAEFIDDRQAHQRHCELAVVQGAGYLYASMY